MAKMTAAQAVAHFLKSMGTERYYFYNGHANWGLLDALEYEAGIKGIRARHEIHAIHMADIEWRMRRALPIPVTCTTVGPGNYNTIPGIAEAFFDSVPMLCLMAGGPTKWLGRGGIQETYRYSDDEFVQLFKSITKQAVMTIRPDTALDTLVRAYKTAVSGRPGPVVVYMPLDVQNTVVDVEIPDGRAWIDFARPAPDPDAAHAACALIAAAERPVIWAGTGVNNARAWDDLRALAEDLQIPVATNFGAKGALPEDHPLSLGVCDRAGTGHAVKAATGADLVVNLAARFNDLNTAGWSMYDFGGRQKLVHVDIDPGEMGRVYPVDVGLVCDVGQGLRGLRHAWAAGGFARRDPKPWLAQVDGWRRDWLAEVAPQVTSDLVPLHYARIVKDTSDAVNAFDPQATLISDTGFIMNYVPAFYTLRHPWFATNNQQFGQMGFSTPGVVSGRLNRPDHPVVVFVGDQSFIHTGLSLATATEYGIPGVVIVLDNRTIQAEVEGAQRRFGRGVGDHYRIEATGELWNPDLNLIGQALGATVYNVEAPDQMGPAVTTALESGALSLIVVRSSSTVERYAVPIVVEHGTMPFPYEWTLET
ncbi:MAG: thiamine pyrophosphate-binding protein [Hyphomicrobiales bacterium]|nr:thiamine pyrophosphate-binding protein [Hyphomicrobiales bacterium]MCP5370300.1 thiamine pyrophosphate-binding protein [Hyphomicrobiales bacterium]